MAVEAYPEHEEALPALPPGAAAPLRLGAILWLVAFACSFNGAVLDLLSLYGRIRLDWYTAFTLLGSPAVYRWLFSLYLFIRAPLLAQVATALLVLSSIGWVFACWLLTDLPAWTASAARPWLRVVSVIALLLGLIFDFFPGLGLGQWLDVDVLNALVALLVALHLRKVAALLDNRSLHWLAPRLALAAAGWLLLHALSWGSRGGMPSPGAAASAVGIVTGIGLAVAMVQLCRAVPPAPAPDEPAAEGSP